MRYVTELLTSTAFLCLVLFHSAPSLAQSKSHVLVKSYNLEEMTIAADRILVGRLTDSEEGHIDVAGGTLPVTSYTFVVEDVLEGEVGSSLTIRHIGHRTTKSSIFDQSMPDYRENETVMLFLHADSEYGLTSPVGLGQGVFRVKTDGPAKMAVMNERRNKGLLKGSARLDSLMQSEAPGIFYAPEVKDGEIPYRDFRKLVLGILRSR